VEIVASYPEADTLHLVMDNLSSHSRKALVDRFGEKIGGLLWERFTVHYTPKHGRRRQAKAWNLTMNRNHVTINWQFTRKNARQKFGYKKNKFTRSET
jgi:hypothetical protein